MLDDQGREVKPLESLRWAVDNGANFGLARIAQRAAVYADPVFACMRELQSDAVKAKFPKQPDGDDWLRFYRRHRDLWVRIGNETLGFNGGNRLMEWGAATRFVIRFWDKLKALMRVQSLEKRRSEFARELEAELFAHKRELREMRDECQNGTPEVRKGFERRLATRPQLQFALSVVLPRDSFQDLARTVDAARSPRG
jgi:hypothetical protein